MIGEILFIIALILVGISSFLFVKYSIQFFKLIKERDGYYLAKWLF